MIHIRPCVGLEELEACVQLEVATWGYDHRDILPRKAFLVIQKTGGQIFGAFDTALDASSDADRMIGFAMAMAGIRATDTTAAVPYLHSHMLAVLPAYRNQGIGQQLKRAQRDEALARGITRMEWTFDPLEIKNAHLNLNRLGAVVRRYHADFYGASSSQLQGGLPTDRLVAEWQMNSGRVQRALDGAPQTEFEIEEQILVSSAVDGWKQSDAERHRALELQQCNRERFQSAFRRGLLVLGFACDSEGNGRFLLGSDTSPHSRHSAATLFARNP